MLKQAMEKYSVSERQACRANWATPEKTQRYQVIKLPDEDQLTHRIEETSCEIWSLWYTLELQHYFNREGYTVNHKRVERIWREQGLKVPKKQIKRARLVDQ